MNTKPKYECIVCQLASTSMAEIHRHQTYNHTQEEMSLSMISLQCALLKNSHLLTEIHYDHSWLKDPKKLSEFYKYSAYLLDDISYCFNENCEPVDCVVRDKRINIEIEQTNIDQTLANDDQEDTVASEKSPVIVEEIIPLDLTKKELLITESTVTDNTYDSVNNSINSLCSSIEITANKRSVEHKKSLKRSHHPPKRLQVSSKRHKRSKDKSEVTRPMEAVETMNAPILQNSGNGDSNNSNIAVRTSDTLVNGDNRELNLVHYMDVFPMPDVDDCTVLIYDPTECKLSWMSLNVQNSEENQSLDDSAENSREGNIKELPGTDNSRDTSVTTDQTTMNDDKNDEESTSFQSPLYESIRTQDSVPQKRQSSSIISLSPKKKIKKTVTFADMKTTSKDFNNDENVPLLSNPMMIEESEKLECSLLQSPPFESIEPESTKDKSKRRISKKKEKAVTSENPNLTSKNCNNYENIHLFSHLTMNKESEKSECSLLQNLPFESIDPENIKEKTNTRVPKKKTKTVTSEDTNLTLNDSNNYENVRSLSHPTMNEENDKSEQTSLQNPAHESKGGENPLPLKKKQAIKGVTKISIDTSIYETSGLFSDPTLDDEYDGFDYTNLIKERRTEDSVFVKNNKAEYTSLQNPRYETIEAEDTAILKKKNNKTVTVEDTLMTTDGNIFPNTVLFLDPPMNEDSEKSKYTNLQTELNESWIMGNLTVSLTQASLDGLFHDNPQRSQDNGLINPTKTRLSSSSSKNERRRFERSYDGWDVDYVPHKRTSAKKSTRNRDQATKVRPKRTVAEIERYEAGKGK